MCRSQQKVYFQINCGPGVSYKVLGCAMVVHCLTLLAPNNPVAMYKKQMHGCLTWLRTFTTSCLSNLFFPKILMLNAPTFSPSHNPAAETISTNARITTRCILRHFCRMNSTYGGGCMLLCKRSINNRDVIHASIIIFKLHAHALE